MTASKRLTLDLEILASEPGELHLPDGTVIIVEAPELGDFLNVMRLSVQYDQNSDPLAAVEIHKELKQCLVELIPDLGRYRLNIDQMRSVIEFLFEMVKTNELDELSKQNITVDGSKKAKSVSSKK